MPFRVALALVLFAATPAAAQTALTVGTPVEGTLAAGGADAYTLALGAEQFVAGRAVQHTADVVVTVTAPDGTTVEAFDVTARGADAFQFTTRAAGTYTFTVTPFEDEAGRYALVVSQAEPVATTPEGTVRQLLAAYDHDDTPGALVAVVRDGAIVYQQAVGMANLTHGIPYALDTRTNIGSTSKQFTAYAIATLAAEGRLTLDDDVRAHLPELPDLGETVTLRHLLTHTSGYREFLNTLAIGGRRLDEGDHIDRDEIVALVQRQPRLQNAPGAEWNYNNTGYALLAQVVERVTGEPFPAWMAAHVFAPMGMTHTAVRGGNGQIVPHSAQGYESSADGWREVQDLGAGASMGAGGIYATVGDLARWIAALQDGTADPAIVRQMTTRAVLTTGDTTDYGMGFFVDTQRGQRRVQHGGADSAHRSAFLTYPDLHAGVIVLTNASVNVDAIAARTAEAFFPDAFADRAEAPVAAADPGASVAFDPAAFDALAGRYSLDEMPAFVLTFRRADDGRYFTQATGQGELEIVPTSDSTFALTAVEASVTFHRDADGAVRSATLHQSGDHRATRRDMAPAAAEAPFDASAAVGRYYSDELQAFVTVTADGDALTMQMPRQDAAPLRPLAGDRFGGPNGSTLTFTRDVAGAIAGFTLDAGRTRDLRFARLDAAPSAP